jgi:hypothetical protein
MARVSKATGRLAEGISLKAVFDRNESMRGAEKCGGFSVRPWEDELEQLGCDRGEARTPVEAPSLLVGLLDDDLEG